MSKGFDAVICAAVQSEMFCFDVSMTKNSSRRSACGQRNNPVVAVIRLS